MKSIFLLVFLIAAASSAARAEDRSLAPTLKVVAFGALDAATMQWHAARIDAKELADKGYRLVDGEGEATDYSLWALGYGCSPSESGWSCFVRAKFGASLAAAREVRVDASAKAMIDAYDLAVHTMIRGLPDVSLSHRVAHRQFLKFIPPTVTAVDWR